MADRPEPFALVGAIYECVFRSEAWPEALAAVQKAVRAECSYLLIHQTDPQAPEMNMLAQHNIDTPMRRLYDQHYVRLNPLLPYLASFGDGQVYSCRHLVVRQEYLRSEFYREWAAPQGMFDYAGVTVIRRNQTSAAVGFTRSGEGNVFDDQSLQVIRGLAPHLTRAVEIQRLMEQQRKQRDDLALLLGSVRCGFLVVDAGLRVLAANPIAEALLEKEDGLTYRHQTLATLDSTGPLQNATRAACRRDRPSGATLPVERGPGRRPLILQIVPMSGSHPDGMFFAFLPATAAIFIVDPESETPGALELFAQIHRLTAAECQVLERLATGDTPAGIASSLGIGTATVRTHLHRLFDKTGTRRQTELLMLFRGFTLPVQPDLPDSSGSSI